MKSLSLILLLLAVIGVAKSTPADAVLSGLRATGLSEPLAADGRLADAAER